MVDNILQSIGILLLVAVLSESLTEIIKTAIKGIIKGTVTYLVSITVGITLAYAFNLNIFSLEGTWSHVSIVSAGLIASRGANYVNGFMKKIGAISEVK